MQKQAHPLESFAYRKVNTVIYLFNNMYKVSRQVFDNLF